MATENNFLKAAKQFSGTHLPDRFLTSYYSYSFAFKDCGDKIVCSTQHAPEFEMKKTTGTSVGEICRFIRLALEDVEREGARPPEKLKGATAAGSFEDLISREGDRLEKEGVLTLGRYPVASAIVSGSSRPVQMPSKPDFEGVTRSGQQFIFEAKVCSSGAFELSKTFLKPKQVQHMLTRAKFGVPCFLLLHFNDRLGKTFYESAFTVAIPVKPVDLAGYDIWEKFVGAKGAYSGNITRKEALDLGRLVPWHIPKQCKGPRPNLLSFLRQV
jgi:hypothetical protein